MSRKLYIFFLVFFLGLGSVSAYPNQPEIVYVRSIKPDVVAPDNTSVTVRVNNTKGLNGISSISVLLGLYGSRYSIPVSVSAGLDSADNYPVEVGFNWAQVYKDLGLVNEHIDPLSIKVVNGKGHLVPSQHSGYLGYWDDLGDTAEWSLWSINELDSEDYSFTSNGHIVTLAMNSDQNRTPEWIGYKRIGLSVLTSAYRYVEYKIKVDPEVTLGMHFREGGASGFLETVYYHDSSDAGSWTIFRQDLQTDFKKGWPYTSGYVTIDTIQFELNDYSAKYNQTSTVNGWKNASIDWIRLVSDTGSVIWLSNTKADEVEKFHVFFDSLEDAREPVISSLNISAINEEGITSALVVNVGLPTPQPLLKWDGSAFLEEYDPNNLIVLNSADSSKKDVDSTIVDFTFDFTLSTDFAEGDIDVFVTVTDSSNNKYSKNFEDIFYVWTNYPRSRELINSVYAYINEAKMTIFQSSEAESLLQDAESEYELGMREYEARNFAVATQHFQNAIDCVNQAYVKESQSRKTSLVMTTWTIVIAFVVIAFAAVIIRGRARKKEN